jgi:hypothetical protein
LIQGSLDGQKTGGPVHEEISSYRHQAVKRMSPLFYFFLEEFGSELIDVFGQMHQNPHLDASARLNMCSKDAVKVIFKDSHLPALEFLDRKTVDILFDVGRMLGTLLNGFARRSG